MDSNYHSFICLSLFNHLIGPLNMSCKINIWHIEILDYENCFLLNLKFNVCSICFFSSLHHSPCYRVYSNLIILIACANRVLIQSYLVWCLFNSCLCHLAIGLQEWILLGICRSKLSIKVC